MAGSTLQEWLNRNSYRAYPFVEDTNFLCTDGKILPKSVILDARFCAFDLTLTEATLKFVEIDTEGKVTIKLNFNNEDITLGPGNGFISCKNLESMIFIRLAVGSQYNLKELAGKYELTTPAPFLKSRILCIPYGIGADTLTSGGVQAVGEIKVEDGTNTSLTIRRNNLVLAVRKGLGKGVDCQLPEDEAVYVCDGSVIRFLNGQKADSNGNIQIYGGEGVSVVTGTYKGIPAVIILTSAEVAGFALR